ncbi:MAG: hypothetical protein BWK80_11495 [Desulfobacteraceae bacterium IS3]|nr:MAG: hypothetical protein BWK80_11495 [Desulfobacteraceae bacterium IS3]
MFKNVLKAGCVMLMVGSLSVPAWSLSRDAAVNTDDLQSLFAGNGPGDGTGNRGTGPKDGTGNGSKSGTCPNLESDVNNDFLAGRGNGPGNGTGNRGTGPKDGTGNGSKSGTCPNLESDVKDDLFLLAQCGQGCGRGFGRVNNTDGSVSTRGKGLRLRDGSCLKSGEVQGLRNGSGRRGNGKGCGAGQGLRDGSGRTNGGRGKGLINGVCPRGMTPPINSN